MAERSVNARQVEVLQWIAGGCDPAEMREVSFKTTAVALQSRRLAQVSRRAGVWRADITPAGRYFLDHGAYPEGHWSSGPTAPHRNSRAQVRRTSPRAAPTAKPVETLLDQVATAGGRIEVPQDDSGYYAGLVASSARHGAAPPGQRLRMRYGAPGRRVIELVPDPVWNLDVSIPDTIRGAHPAVRAIAGERSRTDWWTRATRWLAALVRATDELGFTSKREGGQISIATSDDLVTAVSVSPMQVGPARLKAVGNFLPYGHKVTDTAKATLEDRLPDAIRHLVDHFDERRERRERALEDERRAATLWQTVREEAEAAVLRQRRDAHAEAQIANWRRAGDLRAFARALTERRDASIEDEEAAWVAWMLARADALDPLLHEAVKAPPDRDVKPEDLLPYMRGLSPYGPSRSHLRW